ncbi:MAG: calcium/sodium antiporter [Candidatus Brocadiaceae bacterium]|nr:calcium/sodium antiporter [Candidatus Brocadiaceae bacterium]
MIYNILLLIIGLSLLLGGGSVLVRGSSSLAKNLGVSPLVIGLTVVAFGTSAPELTVNILAALKGSGDISFGNIIGSNIANIGLVLACAAIIRPLSIDSAIIIREIPMMILASAAALIMGCDAFFRNTSEVYDRSDGPLLLLFFGVFFYYTIGGVVKRKSTDPFVKQAKEQVAHFAAPLRWKSISIDLLLTVTGLALLIIGGKISVDSAVTLAKLFRVPEVIIGLTIIAVGTSLPELVTSVIATWRGQTELAVGNVVGSNIFNLLFVTGIGAAIRPIAIPSSGHTDLFMMMALAVILLPISISHQRRIVRLEGIFLLVLYIGYTLWRTLRLG